MRKLLVIGFWLLVCFHLKAHPGIGIVKDSKGNIYYTDLKHVWKISPDGNKSIVVSGVHSHELYMDKEDNLYGEHLWYNGEKLNTWGHYVWCLKNTGELVKVVEPTEGFLSDYSFVRDTAGTMYWVERFTVSRFMKKTTEGKITKIAEGKFGFIGWIHVADDGTIYFTESNKLHKLSANGKFTLLSDNLMSKSTDFSVMGHNYTSYGIWTDKQDNIYIAMIDSKKVIRINPNGKLQTVLQPNSLWTVCSGLFDDNGNLWVLENSVTNEVRARKINMKELNKQDGAVRRFRGQTHLLFSLLTALAIVINFIALKLLLKRILIKQTLKPA